MNSDEIGDNSAVSLLFQNYPHVDNFPESHPFFIHKTAANKFTPTVPSCMMEKRGDDS